MDLEELALQERDKASVGQGHGCLLHLRKSSQPNERVVGVREIGVRPVGWSGEEGGSNDLGRTQTFLSSTYKEYTLSLQGSGSNKLYDSHHFAELPSPSPSSPSSSINSSSRLEWRNTFADLIRANSCFDLNPIRAHQYFL